VGEGESKDATISISEFERIDTGPISTKIELLFSSAEGSEKLN